MKKNLNILCFLFIVKTYMIPLQCQASDDYTDKYDIQKINYISLHEGVISNKTEPTIEFLEEQHDHLQYERSTASTRPRKNSLALSQEEYQSREIFARKRLVSLGSCQEEKRKSLLSSKLSSSQDISKKFPIRSRKNSFNFSNSSKRVEDLYQHQEESLKKSFKYYTSLSLEKNEEYLNTQVADSQAEKVKIWCSSYDFNDKNESIIYFHYFLYNFEIYKNLGEAISISVDPFEVFVYNRSLRIGPFTNLDNYEEFNMPLNKYIKRCKEYDDLWCSSKDNMFVVTNMRTAKPRLVGYNETLLLPSYQYVNEIPIARNSSLLAHVCLIKEVSLK